MNIIEVIPISRGIGADTLSYFTSKEVSIGAIVDIPLRKKIVNGIVISVKSAEKMKSEIKSADFTLKKLEKIKSINFFQKVFMDTMQEIANYYATSIGAVIDSLVPEYILKNISKLKENSLGENGKHEIKTLKEKYVVQGDDDERYGTWKSLIRQEFAKKRSVFFLVPTIEDAERAYSLLEKGVEGYAFMLHRSLLPKKIIEVWNKIMKEDHPVVIIATGSFLSLPRNDIETIVVERESNKTYKIPRRPFLDIRHVAEILAEKKGIKIFYADNFLRIETLLRENEEEMVQASPFKFRSLSTAKDTLIDMKLYKTPNSNFKILSDEIENLIVRTKNESEKMIILATRRGVSPATICGDCQNIVVCNNCSSSVVLHKVGEKSFFMCHRCGERRSTEEYCKICGSWKLGVVGIGIDLVVQKIKDKFPDITIFKIDSDSVSSEKTVHSIIHKFNEKPGSILIGTEMMLQYLHEKVENSGIISLDSLFSLPDFRIQEKILYMLIRIRTLTTQNFIVQTRKSDEKVFEYGLKGNMSDFYRTAIEERKKFNYPPFTVLIKITLEGKKDNIVKDMEQAQNILDPYEVEVFPAFTQTVRGNQVLHGLIRIPYDKWPDQDLIQKIRLLSPSIVVKVDPETLL
ncbi:MAG: primosomal protein N' [Patescibacteria group bacterium]